MSRMYAPKKENVEKLNKYFTKLKRQGILRDELPKDKPIRG